MSLLDRVRPPSSLARAVGAPEQPSGWVPGAIAGLRAAAVSFAVIVVPLLAGWATARHVTATWTQALRVGADGWLLAHHVTIAFPGGRLGLTPLALTLVPVIAIYRAARKLAANPVLAQPLPRSTSSAVKAGSTVKAGSALKAASTPNPSPRALPWRRLVEAWLGLSFAYAGLAVILALLARSPAAHAVLLQAFLAPLVIALAAGGAGLLRAHPAGAELRSRLAERLPAPFRRAIRPAGWGVAALLVVSVATVVLALALQGPRVLALHRALDPGPAGGLLLVAGQAAYLPVLAAWALSWLAGPGFAVGTGTLVAPASVHLGVLPVVPVLGGLPTGPLPGDGWRVAALAVPVVAGLLVGWRAARTHAGAAPSLLSRLAAAAIAAALAALTLTALVVVSAGPIGPGTLQDVGAGAAPVGGALLRELLAGALVAATVSHLLQRRTTRREVPLAAGADEG